MLQQPSTVIVGGGVVGLATAYHYLKANPGKRLVLLEKEDQLARHQTGRNSGVIHSGIYYRPGSSKAENCRKGYQQLLEFCRQHEVPHEICGKLIIATEPEELPRLKQLEQRAQQNGLSGVNRIGPKDIRAIEPHAAGIAALQVPQTGIVDYPDFCRKLATEIEKMGGEIHFAQEVKRIQEARGQIILETSSDSFLTPSACCCAGLHSDRLARLSNPDLDLRIVPFRGEYFELEPAAQGLVKHLIYPVPDPAFPFLGVHFTRMINGGVEAGPNAVLALAKEGYTWGDINLRDLSEIVSWPGFWKLGAKHWKMGGHEIFRSLSKPAFAAALQRLVPEIEEKHLHPAPSGVRAQACHRDGSLLDDFQITRHGRLLHVCNAPSPAATASLAIGQHLADLLCQ